MKVIAFTPLHYGAPYLEASILSLIFHVDEYWIAYVDHASHNGNAASLPCPDTENDLYALAKRAAGRKLRWVKGDWWHEGAQRDAIYDLAPDADVILSADSDEIWCGNLAKHAIENHDFALSEGRRIYRVPIIHFWRSFKRGILDDGQKPERVCYPKSSGVFDVRMGKSHMTRGKDERDVIAHFGYAVPVKYQRYKWSGGHGHQAELRRGWIDEKYIANADTDLHPVNNGFWNAQPIDPRDYLPSWMEKHPYANKDVIE